MSHGGLVRWFSVSVTREFSASVRRGDGGFVAQCGEVDIRRVGSSEDEAVDRLKEAVLERCELGVVETETRLVPLTDEQKKRAVLDGLLRQGDTVIPAIVGALTERGRAKSVDELVELRSELAREREHSSKVASLFEEIERLKLDLSVTLRW